MFIFSPEWAPKYYPDFRDPDPGIGNPSTVPIDRYNSAEKFVSLLGSKKTKKTRAFIN